MADMRLRTMEKAGGPVLNHRRKVLLIIIGITTMFNGNNKEAEGALI